jgi:hypothetical protein
VADSVVTCLYIFQQRLSCVRDGRQEGALQAACKDFQSICSDGQTCCNVVESNLSDSELGRHLGIGSRVLGDIEFLSCVSLGIYPSMVINIPHIMHISCDICLYSPWFFTCLLGSFRSSLTPLIDV